MADNFITNPGASGKTFASDEIAGGPTGGTADYPLLKIAHGPLDTAALTEAVAPFPTDLVVADPKSSSAVAVSVAAGATVDLDSDQIAAGKEGKLVAVEFGGTVPTKAELVLVVNDVESSVKARGFAWPGQMGLLRAPSRQWWTVAQTGPGFDGFRVKVTNLEENVPADLYANHFWDSQ